MNRDSGSSNQVSSSHEPWWQHAVPSSDTTPSGVKSKSKKSRRNAHGKNNNANTTANANQPRNVAAPNYNFDGYPPPPGMNPTRSKNSGKRGMMHSNHQAFENASFKGRRGGKANRKGRSNLCGFEEVNSALQLAQDALERTSKGRNSRGRNRKGAGSSSGSTSRRNSSLTGTWRNMSGQKIGSGDWTGKVDDHKAGMNVRAWTLADGLEPWEWSPWRYVYGAGNKRILLERDAEPGVWKVIPFRGNRFSPSWLDGVLDWAKVLRRGMADSGRRFHHPPKPCTPSQNSSGPSSSKDQTVSNASSSIPTSTEIHVNASKSTSQEGSQNVTNASSEVVSQIQALGSISSTTELPSQQGRRLGQSISGASLTVCTDDSLADTACSPARGSKCPNAGTVDNAGDETETRVDQEQNEPAEGTVQPEVGAGLDAVADKSVTEEKSVREEDDCEMVGVPKVCISVRCEKMGLTDVEVEMLADWSERNAGTIIVSKLWLFDNKLTDTGAKHCTRMIREELLELHLSHNTLTNQGAELILFSIPTTRDISLGRPLWLRMEWNMIVVDKLMKVLKKFEETRGLLSDIPRFQLKKVKGKMSSYLMNDKPKAHVRLPWIQSQRLRPAEAPVLIAAKTCWQTRKSPLDEQDASKAHADEPTVQPKLEESLSCGPLLIFPDTSALLGLIGCSRKGQSPPLLTFEMMQSLCMKKLFGRCLPANERIFFVLCDSVVKQLDGLKKQNPYVGHAIRKLMSSGLEQYGPAGQDFLTILGAHEGEGMVVDRNAEVLDSRSHNVHDKGQATDLKIVEVALFFQQELCKSSFATKGRATGDSTPSQRSGETTPKEKKPDQMDAADPSVMSGVIQSAQALPVVNDPKRFPVVLLSNDNVQLVAAKCHGLPAFRFADFRKCPNLKFVMERNRPLLASGFRKVIGEWAVKGLGESAKKSLQDEFDGAVACMKRLLESYEDARDTLDRARELLSSHLTPHPTIEQLKVLLGIGDRDDQDDQDDQTDLNDLNESDELDVVDVNRACDRTSSGGCSSVECEMEIGGEVEEIEVENVDSVGNSDEGGLGQDGVSEQVDLNVNVNVSGSSQDASEEGASDDVALQGSCDSNDHDSGDLSENELVPLVKAKLEEWEGLVKSYQHPSRVLRWITGTQGPTEQ